MINLEMISRFCCVSVVASFDLNKGYAVYD